MRAQEFITEARLADLYHGTHLDNAEEILATDTLYPGDQSHGDEGHVSMTRNLGVAIVMAQYGEPAGVIFVLDQPAIVQRTRLQPFDWGGGYDEMEEISQKPIKNINRAIKKIIVLKHQDFDPAEYPRVMNDTRTVVRDQSRVSDTTTARKFDGQVVTESQKFITEIKGCGDCFEVAGRAMITPEVPDMRLVHAYVTGQGPVAGKRFSHAWNEVGDVVLDYSNGRQVVMRKPQYYELGQISTEPGEYAVYDDAQAKKKMVQTRHWGPWDLDPSKEALDEFLSNQVGGGDDGNDNDPQEHLLTLAKMLQQAMYGPGRNKTDTQRIKREIEQLGGILRPTQSDEGYDVALFHPQHWRGGILITPAGVGMSVGPPDEIN